jgi:hypothetical protein
VASMDAMNDARVVIHRAIVDRYPPGPERERWLQWLQDYIEAEKKRRPEDAGGVLAGTAAEPTMAAAERASPARASAATRRSPP